MAKHLASSKSRSMKMPELKIALPKLMKRKHVSYKRSYEREFSIGEMLPVLAAVILFIVAYLLPVGLWLKIVAFAIACLAAGFGILKRGVDSVLRGSRPSEELLVLLAALIAFCIGEYAAGTLAVILYRIGELTEAYALARSAAGINALRELLPEKAKVEIDYGAVDAVAESVEVGEILRVAPGEVFPLDGEILEGIATVDASPLTGSAATLTLGPGGEVYAGCVNRGGPVRVKATRKFEDSFAAQMLSTFEDNETQTQTEKKLNRYSGIYTLAVAALALLLGFVPPLVNGQWTLWLHRAAVLLLIASPSALILTVPLAYLGGLVCAWRKGIALWGKDSLEKLARTKTMVFGKTGAITEGKYTITDVFPSGVSEEELLAVAAAAESYSRHPIAIALKQAAGWTPEVAEGAMEVEEIPGRGVSAFIEGKHVYVGNAALLDEHGIWYKVPSRAGAAIHVAVENSYWGHVLLADKTRENAFDALETLRMQGVSNLVMLTGDVLSVSRPIASSLNFDMVKAELTPQGKLSAVDYLRKGGAEGSFLAYVGDGTNDAPMFAKADLGIALNTLRDRGAADTADVAVLEDDIMAVPAAMRVAVAANRIALENILGVSAMKLLVLLVALFGHMPLLLAALLEAVFSAAAAINALRAFGTE